MPRFTRSQILFLLATILLYAAGCILAAHQHGDAAISKTLRSTAILLLGWAAIKRRSLTGWILWAMLAGVELGLDAPAAALHIRFLSDIFLRLIRTIVAPLILGTLITGIAAHGSSGSSLGRLGWKSLVFFEVLTSVALAIGFAAINVSHAGVGLGLSSAQPSSSIATSALAVPPAAAPLHWDDFLVHVVPENLAKAVAENQLLQVAVFAVLFGISLGQLSEAKRRPMLQVVESLTQTMFKFTNLVMYLAPFAVAAALAYTVAHAGASAMLSLGELLATMYAALAVFAVIGLLPAALIARVPLRRFLVAIAEPATIAFATSTSEAALPIAMERMEELGVPARIVGFVMPAGYTFNLTGSALYLSLASIFVAQAGGIAMGWPRQLAMLGALMITSKGLAGIPRAAMVVLLATAATFQLPPEPIVLLLGVDALLDMGRTVANVVGNCLACAVVARWEGETLSPRPQIAAADIGAIN